MIFPGTEIYRKICSEDSRWKCRYCTKNENNNAIHQYFYVSVKKNRSQFNFSCITGTEISDKLIFKISVPDPSKLVPKMVQDDFFAKNHESFEKTHTSQNLRSWNKVFVKSPLLKWEGLNYPFNLICWNTSFSHANWYWMTHRKIRTVPANSGTQRGFSLFWTPFSWEDRVQISAITIICAKADCAATVIVLQSN